MSAPVTPESLTDEMIRGEQLLATGLPRRKAFQRVLDCDTALHGGDTPQETRAARQRICDAINARAKDGAR